MVLGEPRPILSRTLFNRRALAFAQERVGGELDIASA